MDDDWIPPSGQQPLTPPAPILTRPVQTQTQSSQHEAAMKKRKTSPEAEVDLFPSPETALDDPARQAIQCWADKIGTTPKRLKTEHESPKAKTPPHPIIRKISNIQPGKLPLPKGSPPKVRLQTNGLALPMKEWFDPWNACTMGHQRAENRMSGSVDWRISRERKWKEQFGDGTGGGGKRMWDTVGAGSRDFGKDGRMANGGWEKGAKGLRTDGQKSIVECFGSKKSSQSQAKREEKDGEMKLSMLPPPLPALEDTDTAAAAAAPPPKSNIFQNVVIYVNGSTYPIISDHTLRQLIIQHGGSLSIALLRKSITHVILTHKDQLPSHPSPSLVSPSTFSSTTLSHSTNKRDYQAAGGGLAAQKIRKEISHLKPSGIKYVSAHWVVESVKAGRRLPEDGFTDWRFVERGQSDVRGFYSVDTGKQVKVGTVGEGD